MVSREDVTMKLLGLEFAPLNVPWSRRLQTFAVLHYVSTFMLGGTLGTVVCIWLLFTQYYWVSLVYLIWFAYDHESCERGGRRVRWLRKWSLWRHYRDYFPIHLIKTADLDPNENYIFGYHPHGLLGAGAFGNFGTDASDFASMFPGITPSLVTLATQFWLPFYREYMLAMGLCSSSKESIEYLLTKNGKGNAVVVVVGGAAEAIDAHANRPVVLTLKNRKGFIKLALRYGVSLVPVFSFGENEIFSQAPNPEGSILRMFQNKFKNKFGFSPVFFKGRGIFQYTFGFLPYRSPIYTVVGAPLHVERIEEPTNEQVDHYHAKYIQSLEKLFLESKSQLGDVFQNYTLKV